MELNLYQYPVIQGIKVSSSVRSILVTGLTVNSHQHCADTTLLSNESTVPVLIEPDMKNQVFLEFCYEQNPVDKLCNKRFVLKSKGLRLIYHAVTINNIVYFFRSSEFSQQKKIKNAAIRTINRVKERSYMFMKNNLQNIKHMDLNIDIQPSYLFVPQNGVYAE